MGGTHEERIYKFALGVVSEARSALGFDAFSPRWVHDACSPSRLGIRQREYAKFDGNRLQDWKGWVIKCAGQAYKHGNGEGERG